MRMRLLPHARRFPGLQVAVAYLQAALQQEVATITGQPFGSFASLNGVPLNMDFITAADIVDGAKRGFGQSCLTEENAVYQARACSGCWGCHACLPPTSFASLS